ncbi:MAG TPA: phosphoribosylanthranilate isomerase [Oceanospirillales bacterium]|nr:phosphoribosylanthranilate isomerase [Oceanospirillales bacterium]
MKNNYFVKFCGITSTQDAKNAEKAGCNAIGFVFAKKSKRLITPEKCQAIIQQLSPMTLTVALFANNSASEVQETLNICSPNVLQFHGEESPEFCQQWNRPYWKAIPMAENIESENYVENYVESYVKRYATAQAYLIDNFSKNTTGGSGEVFDWNKIPQNIDQRWILAGGLSPENIKIAKQKTKIKCFDVSSGIEKSAGVKDYAKMQQFIKNLIS